MKSRALAILFLAIGLQGVQAQNSVLDSLSVVLREFTQKKNFQKDTSYLNTLNQYAFGMAFFKPDSSIAISQQCSTYAQRAKYPQALAEAIKNIGLANNLVGNYNAALNSYEKALAIAEKNKLLSMAGKVLHNRAICYNNLGRYPEALEDYFKALKIREELGEKLGISSSTTGIGNVYFNQGKYDDALEYYQKGLDIAKEINYLSGIEMGYANLGEVYLKKENFQQSSESLSKALEISSQTGNKEVASFITYLMGRMLSKQQKYQEAISAYHSAIDIAAQLGSKEYIARSQLGLANTFLALPNLDSSYFYADQGLKMAANIGYTELQRDGYELLSKIYEARHDGFEALKYYKLFKGYADSINNQQTEKRAMNLAAAYEYSKKELLLKAEFDSQNTRQNWIIFSAFAALISSVVVAGLIYRSRMKEKHSNTLLQQKNEEIDAQRNNLETALAELKAAQHQLIQSEKMASLGEMTAGIAHEIQNPLNFVNNFSEVSVELVEELTTALQKGDQEEAKALLTDLTLNLDKINHHGKRAGDIVRSMLQHSRNNSGGKELTDINALCDEYLRLAYHGLRAKDKTFNASFETLLDPTVGKLNIIPQEIGRVLLNLINNAFYAVSQRQKALAANGHSDQEEKYSPAVWVQTKNKEKEVEIRIGDNGTGIPSHLVDKVFQPFFTTKPTGEGTGLGLSLSYDIVTNGHQGQLQLESNDQNGTTFIILLPKNT